MKKLIPFLLLMCFLSCKEPTIYKYTIKLNYEDCSCLSDTVTFYGGQLRMSYEELLLDEDEIGTNLRSYEILSKIKVE